MDLECVGAFGPALLLGLSFRGRPSEAAFERLALCILSNAIHEIENGVVRDVLALVT
jgi:hypothetical protein